MTNFTKWLDTFVAEKGINTDQTFTVKGSWGDNFMPLEVVLNAIKSAPASEQSGIKNMLVKIDFHNACPVHYFKHLAQAIAI